jgi:hypothetical protein
MVASIPKMPVATRKSHCASTSTLASARSTWSSDRPAAQGNESGAAWSEPWSMLGLPALPLDYVHLFRSAGSWAVF